MMNRFSALLSRLMLSAAFVLVVPASVAPVLADGMVRDAGVADSIIDQPPMETGVSVLSSTTVQGAQQDARAHSGISRISVPEGAERPAADRVSAASADAQADVQGDVGADAEALAPLSLSSMVLFALSDNPDVRMALAREDASRANIGKAKAKFLPLIDFVAEGGSSWDKPSAGTDNQKGNDVFTTRVALTGTQLIYDFDKSQLALDQQKQLSQSARLDTQVNVEETMNRTIESYLQMLQFQRSLKTGSEFVARMRALNDTIAQTYEAGASSKATLDYANSRMASAETDLNTTKANINDARSNLEFLTGPLPEFRAVAPDDLDPARTDIKQYIEMAESRNTGVQLSDSDLDALKKKIDIAKSAYYPSVNFVLTAEDKHNDGGYVDNQDKVKGVVQLSYRLYDGGSRKHDVRLARAQVRESEINQEKILKELRRQIRQSYNQILSIQDSRKQTLKEIASSDALQQLNRENFRLGSINVIELIEGEERLNGAHTKLYQLDSDMYLNVYRLLITSGLLKQNFFCDSCGATSASR